MKLKYCLTGIVLLLLQCKAYTQTINKTITGSIVDINNYSPIADATITVKHSAKTVVTNNEGSFSIVITAVPDTLVISHISYKTKRVTVTANTTTILIKLDEAVNAMQDVVVSTGYENIPKERATGSFVTIDRELLNKRVSTDIISKLDGIASGLVFSKGVPNRNAELIIRGQSTLFANAQPLIVVDNFPYEGDINTINPNDVANITILKDAAAASIWGVRAGNGVIVITTKKSVYNRPLQVSLNTNVTVSEKPDLFYDPRFLSSPGFTDMESLLFKNGFYDADFSATDYRPVSPVVDLLHKAQQGIITMQDADAQINAFKNIDIRNELSKYFYRHPVSQQYSVGLQGGSAKASYYFSAGYDNDASASLGSNNSRITLHTSDVFTPVRNLEITTGIDYVISNANSDNTLSQINLGGPTGKNIYPYALFADASGNALPIVKDYSPSFVQQATANGFLNWQFYPLTEVHNGYNRNVSSSFETRVSANIKYTIAPGLNAEVKYQFEKSTGNSTNLANTLSYYARNLVNTFSDVSADGKVQFTIIPQGGVLDASNNALTAHNLRGQLNYNKGWNKHVITALAGAEMRQVTNDGDGDRLYGYNDALATFIPVDPTQYYTTYPTGNSYKISTSQNISSALDRFRSWFANAAYTYNGKYTVSASGRIDASNYFGVDANKKNVPLWSTGVKWDIDKEAFYNSNALPSLKLRITYGFNGNLDRNVTALTTAQYSSSDPYTGLPFLTIVNPPNKNLQWEKTGMLNMGADFAIVNNIITGTVEYYRKKGTDIIGDNALAPSTGFINLNFYTNTIKGNYASIKGNGWDVQLTTKNFDRRFKWSTRFLFSYNTDKVTHYGGSNPPTQLVSYGSGANGFVIPNEGKPVYGIYSFKWAGLDGATGDPQGYINDTISKNYTALTSPATVKDIQYNGPARPVFFGGVMNTFSWKHFTLFVNISYKLDYYFRRTSINYYNLFNFYQGNKDYYARWQNKGDEKTTQVPSLVYPANYSRDIFYTNSAVLVEKGGNIRLQDINLSYDINERLVRRWHISNFQLYVYINNVGILWRANKEGLDPDYPLAIPAERSYAIGIRTNF